MAATLLLCLPLRMGVLLSTFLFHFFISGVVGGGMSYAVYMARAGGDGQEICELQSPMSTRCV